LIALQLDRQFIGCAPSQCDLGLIAPDFSAILELQPSAPRLASAAE
jgi:hypothetical protein